MARATVELVDALRRTAARLAAGGAYRWSHFGQCNCGNLAQTITCKSPQELQHAAYIGGDDWGAQAREYCPTSGYPLDFVFEALFAIGMEASDVQRLERLSDGRVLQYLGRSDLKHNERDDVVRYMLAWADLLAQELAGAASVATTQEELPFAAE